MEPIRVVVNGALGRMGKEVMWGLVRDPEIEIVGAAEKQVTQMRLPLPEKSESVPFSSNLGALLDSVRPDVLVDFTTYEACMMAARVSLSHKVNIVVGTTGLAPADLKEIEELAFKNNVGAVVAANFSIGAVLLQHYCKLAARWFDHAEIIEMHHNEKADAPSGTALATARMMVEGKGGKFTHSPTKKETLGGVRGGEVEGIPIHSIRLPGFMASQEVIFGTLGQRLVLRHDTINRECYIPGVTMAVKEVVKRKGLVNGLDKLLNL
ncbi:MAG: 4-hydroxy-tetrahydrodipicolinate reductase [Chloroflexota bacterium]